MSFDFKSIFDTTPMHINEKGMKFWWDEDCNKYVKTIYLDPKRVQCYLVEFPTGERTRLIVLDGSPHEEDQSLEGIGVKLDILKLLLSEEI